MYTKAIILGSLMLLLGCSSQQKEPKDKKPDKKTIVKDTVPEKPKYDIWDSSNAVEKLTKYGKENPQKIAIINTSMGKIKVQLFEDTPLHRANFVRLSKTKFYDSTQFFRVEENFMIQGGMTSDVDNYEYNLKRLTAGYYRIPSEINKKYPHVSGTLAMANNSTYTKEGEEKDYSSDPYNFYIVDNRRVSTNYINKTEKKYGIKISSSNKKRYKNEGGSPHLDMQYTVFGKVISGMNIVNKIAAVEASESRRPLEPVYIYNINIIE